jgi:hypothetical protein
VLNLQINKSSERAIENMVAYYEASIARDLANQSLGYLLTQLADSATWRVVRPALLPSSVFADVGPSTILYTVRDTVVIISGRRMDAIRMDVEAKYEKQTHHAAVYIDRNFGVVPPAVRGAMTAQGPLNQTVSDMLIDGRDHNLQGNIIPKAGVFGVSSAIAFTNLGTARIGGTSESGSDYPPSYPENPAVVEQEYNWDGAFPNSPDQVLGLSEGTLKEIAKSGKNGSQYVTNPRSLKFPLSGVTYVELPAGVTWRGAKLGTNPTGILVVHNGSLSSRVDNVSTAGKTAFTGLIIADNMFHIHLDVLGAIVLLSKNLETVRECRGNDDHRVRFSSEAIRRAIRIVQQEGSGWAGRVPVLGWKE